MSMNAYGINESGYYPPGAEFDPRAPWNETDEEGYDYSDDYCDECGQLNENCVGDHDPANEHDEFCGVNRANARGCDCNDDY